MNKVLIYLLLITGLFLSSSDFVYAVIEFDENGRWETTFDCAEEIQRVTGDTHDGFTCNGMGNAGAWTCSDGQGENADSINEFANFNLGGGGNGFSHMQGDGTNNRGGGIHVDFQTPQREFWIRSYIRYENGFSWDGIPHYDKLFYIWTINSSGNAAIAGLQPSSSGKFGIVRQGPSGTPFMPIKGWSDIYPSEISDGSWFSFEIYLKMEDIVEGVSQNNGAVRVWLNGELQGYNDTYSWSGEDQVAVQGWQRILIGSNQNNPNGGRCFRVDFDDIVIYNQTPPNFDTQGNPFIGPIVLTQEDTTPPSAPSGLSVS